jgi:peptidoglycan-associated lipoprotein
VPPPLESLNAMLEDVYFAYDRSEISGHAMTALQHDAGTLRLIFREFPGLKVIVGGHCDERGSAEYNLGLGERRARRAEDVLREYGVPAGAIEVVSYGKEAPQCTEPAESCWQKNRRAHMAVKR